MMCLYLQVCGIKGASALLMLDWLDFTKIFPVDWMHAVLLGVTKALLRLWLDNKEKNKVFFIGDKVNTMNSQCRYWKFKCKQHLHDRDICLCIVKWEL